MDTSKAHAMALPARSLTGQVAVTTMLIGSAAALSSAVVAVPVGHVGFSASWDKGAPSRLARAPRRPVAAYTTAPQSELPVAAASRSKGMTFPAVNRVKPVMIGLPQNAAVLLPLPVAEAQPANLATASLATAGRAADVADANAHAPGLSPRTIETRAGALPSVPPSAVVVPTAEAQLDAAAPGVLAPAAALPPGDRARPIEAPVPLRLVNPPELRGFDLGRLAHGSKSAATALAAPAARAAPLAKPAILGDKDRLVENVVFHQVSLSLAGSDGTPIDVRIGADMKPSIKVGDLLALVTDRMDADSAARFAAASGAEEYVSLATLRAAGFEVAYSAGADSISIAAAP